MQPFLLWILQKVLLDLLIKNESIEEEYKKKISSELSQKKHKFSEALGNDLNTAGAIAIIYDLAKPLKNFFKPISKG